MPWQRKGKRKNLATVYQPMSIPLYGCSQGVSPLLSSPTKALPLLVCLFFV